MRSWIKPALFIACLIPLAQLVYGFYTDDLTANPIEYITRFTGSWALIILITSLAVTPLRKIFGWNTLIRYRRMLGLFAFFYIAMHFAWYLCVDQAFAWSQLLADIAKRPFITAGFLAFVLLVPLAFTSTQAAMRRLGRRWQKLHRLVYPAAVLGCVHYWWQVKADVREPLVYAGIAAVLLGWRALRAWRRRRATAGRKSSVAGTGTDGRERDRRQDQQPSRPGPGVQRLADQPPAEQ